MHAQETVTLTRDTEALLIPAGTRTILPAGAEATITQSLGGTYTVVCDGVLARISAKDADALGRQVEAVPHPGELPPPGKLDEKLVWDQMRTCYDPEIPVNIVDLGLIYDCVLSPDETNNGTRVEVKMTLTAPGCGMGPAIASDVEQKIQSIPGVTDVRVEVVWDPPWNQSMMTEAAKLQLGLL